MVRKVREEPGRVVLTMPRALIERIDDFRFKHRLLSRAAAVRALIETGLRRAEHQTRSSASKDDPPLS